MGALESALAAGRISAAIPANVPEEDLPAYNRMVSVLQRCPVMLQHLAGFDGASTEILVSILDASPESEQAAIHAVEPDIRKLLEVFEHSQDLGQVVIDALGRLTRLSRTHTSSARAREHLIAQQKAWGWGLTRIFAHAMRVGEIKSAHPAIQNSLSFYRRSHGALSMDGAMMGPQTANEMSMFFAHADPVERYLARVIDNMGWDAAGMADLINTLAAAVSHGAVNTERDVMVCFRGMTAAYVIADAAASVKSAVAKVRINAVKKALAKYSGFLNVVSSPWLSVWGADAASFSG